MRSIDIFFPLGCNCVSESVYNNASFKSQLKGEKKTTAISSEGKVINIILYFDSNRSFRKTWHSALCSVSIRFETFDSIQFYLLCISNVITSLVFTMQLAEINEFYILYNLKQNVSKT